MKKSILAVIVLLGCGLAVFMLRARGTTAPTGGERPRAPAGSGQDPVEQQPPPGSGAQPPGAEPGQHTHQDSQYGFTLSYPEGYVLQPRKPGLVLRTKEHHERVQQVVGSEPPISDLFIHVYDNPEQLSPLQWAEKNPSQSNLGLAQGEEPRYRNREFAGQSAISYTWCGLYCCDSTLFTGPDKRHVFDVSVCYETAEDPNRPKLTAISETFKF